MLNMKKEDYKSIEYISNNGSESLKIFCVYHRPMPTINQNGYVPIFVGNKIRQQKIKEGEVNEELVLKYMKGALTDDLFDDDNISDLNRYVNEMTAVYWLWKHYDKIGNPAYIGLSHYRRFFAFNESLPLDGRPWLPHSSTTCLNFVRDAQLLTDTTCAKAYFDDGYGILTTRKYDAALLGEGDKSCRERFCHINKAWDGTLYDEMERLVLERYPDYLYEVKSLRKHASHYLFNMFVMKRELFFKYCEFIFPILCELQKKGPKNTSAGTMREPGFLSEFLTSMFISHQIRCGVSVKELNTIYIDFPEGTPPPTPEKKQSYFKKAKSIIGSRLSFVQLIYLMLRKVNPRNW